MVPLLRFYFHEEVRQAAVQSLPALLRCAHTAAKTGSYPNADMNYVQHMLNFMWQPFMDAMAKVGAVKAAPFLLHETCEIGYAGLLLTQLKQTCCMCIC